MDAVVQQEQRDRDRLARVAQMREFMGSPGSRAFLMRVVFEYCGALQSSFGVDPLATAFGEGRRSVGLRLLSEIDDLTPELLLLARREQLDRVERERSEQVAKHKQGDHDGSEG
jgi:hypothetical protein